MIVLNELLDSYGFSFGSEYVRQCCRLLETEQRIESETQGRHTYAIHLLDTGDYLTTPFHSVDTKTATVHEHKIDKLLTQAERLSLTERLALTSQLVSGCVSEVEQTHRDLKTVVASIDKRETK